MNIRIYSQEDFHQHPLLSRLLELHDVPEKMYVAGNLPDIHIDEFGRADPRILTVVGSRNYTTYGKLAVEKMVKSLSGAPVIILSGLALGIDGLSHTTALKNNIATMAVPGSGLDPKVIYPRNHLPLAEEILSDGGCLISELEPNTGAAQWTFPARNRIMAAMSDAVLVIEATEKSGTLITARMALELGKDIGAIPGDIFSDSSFGTNMLIKEGAYIIRNEDDLYDLLHLKRSGPSTGVVDYTREEKLVLDLLSEPLEKDLLMIRSELSPDHFMMTMTSLEMKGCIQETFGEIRKVL